MSEPSPHVPTVGDRIIALLERFGVEVVFGIPGSHNLPIFSGLANSTIRLVNPKHEQGAGFAADGYARASGRPGVCVTTTGPGILNAATALATAYADSVPVLAISPGARVDDEGQELGWLHESRDQHGALASLLPSIRCRSERHVYRAIADAFTGWAIGRTRPVHIEVPIEVLSASAVEPFPAMNAVAPAAADPKVLAVAAEALRSAVSPVIVAGGGAVAARDVLAVTADLLGAPVVTTRAAAGIRRAAGDVLPATVLPYAPEALRDADVLLVVGSELSRRDLPEQVRRELGRIIRIDIEPQRLYAGRGDDLLLVADAGRALAELNRLLTDAPGTSTSRTVADERQERYAAAITAAYPGPLEVFHRALSRLFSDDVIITGDSSQVSYLGTGAHYPFQVPRSFLYPDAFAPLGYGLPAAIGAALACPDREVVALTGDGAFFYSVAELATAVEERLPLLQIVMDNGGYREIEEEMVTARVPPIGVRFDYPDIVAVAQAFGATSARVRSIDEIAEWRDHAKDSSGPTVLVLGERDLEAIVS